MPWTNKGAFRMLGWVFNAVTLPTNFYGALVTSAATPGVDTNLMSDLTEVAAGNGYTAGGLSLTKNTTDFPTITEDDTNDRGSIQIKNLVWTASGGNLPSSGNGARHLVMTDDNVTVSSREVYASFDLSSDRTVSDGQTLTIQNAELRLSTV